MNNVSSLGQALDQIERLKNMQMKLGTLQTQLTTGKKARQFKGLGTDVIFSQRARTDIKGLATYNNNIDIADRRVKMKLNVLGEIKQQAANVANALQIQTQEGEYEMEVVSDLARKALSFMKNLVNEKDGDRYLFGGADTLNQPLTDSGTMESFINSQLQSWVNTDIDTDTLIGNYHDKAIFNDTIMGYSATLTSGNAKGVSVRVDQSTEIDFTVLANNEGLRDILTATGMLAGIDNVLDKVVLEDGDDPLSVTTAPGADKKSQNENFYKFFNDLSVMLNKAMKEIEKEEFKLSQIQATISQVKDNNKLQQNILEETISDVEDIDPSEVAVKLNSLQVQLEASYRVTGALQNMSLANFL